MALRGHASIQGSTDIPTLFNILPGYLPMPNAEEHQTLQEWVDSIRHPGQKGFWANADAYGVNLLKAYWGDAATAGERLLLRLPAQDHRRPRHLPDRARHDRRQGEGLLPARPEPRRRLGPRPGAAARHGQPRLARRPRPVRDRERDLLEGRRPRSRPARSCPRSAAPRCSSCRRPPTWRRRARSPRPSGCCSGGRRRSTRRATAAPSCGSSTTSAGWSGSGWPAPPSRGPPGARPRLGLPDARRARRAERRGRAPGDQRLRGRHRPAAVDVHRDEGRRLDRSAAAGSTPASSRTASTRPPGASPAGSSPGSRPSGAGRGRRTGGSSTTGPRPTPRAGRGASARPTSGGTRRPGSGPGTTCRTSRRPSRRRTARPRARRASRHRRRRPVHHAGRREGRGSTSPQGLIDGPMPTHYEPVESPFRNPLYGQQANPTRKEYERADNRINPSPPRGREVFPFVFTTSRLTEHHTAGGMSRYLEHLAELQPEMFVEVSPELAAERGPRAPGLVPRGHRAVRHRGPGAGHRPAPAAAVEGRTVHQVWLPYHWGQRRAGHRRLRRTTCSASRSTPTC